MARDSDGRKLAVKVQHSGLREMSKVDIMTIEGLVGAIRWLFPDFNYQWLVEEVRENLPKELDFEHEAGNNERCRANLSSPRSVVGGQVVLPKVRAPQASRMASLLTLLEACWHSLAHAPARWTGTGRASASSPWRSAPSPHHPQHMDSLPGPYGQNLLPTLVLSFLFLLSLGPADQTCPSRQFLEGVPVTDTDALRSLGVSTLLGRAPCPAAYTRLTDARGPPVEAQPSCQARCPVFCGDDFHPRRCPL